MGGTVDYAIFLFVLVCIFLRQQCKDFSLEMLLTRPVPIPQAFRRIFFSCENMNKMKSSEDQILCK